MLMGRDRSSASPPSQQAACQPYGRASVTLGCSAEKKIGNAHDKYGPLLYAARVSCLMNVSFLQCISDSKQQSSREYLTIYIYKHETFIHTAG